MSTAPYFPLYLKDWLMDTRGFTHEDKGVLMDLLVVAWERGGIPVDTEAIRKLALCSKPAWARVWPTVQAGWIERDGVFIYPKLEVARTHVEKRAAAAKAKADKRWSGDAAALPQHCHGNAEPACPGNAQQTTDNKQQTTDNSTTLAIARVVAPSPSDEPTALRYPTVGKDPSWALTEAQLSAWSALFPGLDVLAECRSALAWVLANPGRRKTARGMPAFLVAWLGRSNDRARPVAGPIVAGPVTRGERVTSINQQTAERLAARYRHAADAESGPALGDGLLPAAVGSGERGA